VCSIVPSNNVAIITEEHWTVAVVLFEDYGCKNGRR